MCGVQEGELMGPTIVCDGCRTEFSDTSKNLRWMEDMYKALLCVACRRRTG